MAAKKVFGTTELFLQIIKDLDPLSLSHLHQCMRNVIDTLTQDPTTRSRQYLTHEHDTTTTPLTLHPAAKEYIRLAGWDIDTKFSSIRTLPGCKMHLFCAQRACTPKQVWPDLCDDFLATSYPCTISVDVIKLPDEIGCRRIAVLEGASATSLRSLLQRFESIPVTRWHRLKELPLLQCAPLETDVELPWVPFDAEPHFLQVHPRSQDLWESFDALTVDSETFDDEDRR